MLTVNRCVQSRVHLPSFLVLFLIFLSFFKFAPPALRPPSFEGRPIGKSGQQAHGALGRAIFNYSALHKCPKKARTPHLSFNAPRARSPGRAIGSRTRLASTHSVPITTEDGTIGGFGDHVLRLVALDGLDDGKFKIHPMVQPDTFI